MTINPFGDKHNGIYSVAVFNEAGSVISANVSVYVSKYDITDGVIGYWKLNEASGTVAANSATGGKPAQLVSFAPGWGPGKVGNSLFLDVGDYLYVTNYTKPTVQMAGAAWVKVDSSGIGDADMAIIRNCVGALTYGEGIRRGQFELGLVNAGGGVLRPMAAVGLGPNIVRVTSTLTMPLDTWHLLAFTADGAQIRLFLDGAQVDSLDYLPHDITVPDMNWLSIGTWATEDTNAAPAVPLIPDTTTPNMFVGSMDEIVLWNRALTTEEMTKMYAAGQAGQPFTTVVLNPPTYAPTLTMDSAGGNITLTWDRGVLITAPTINGPWSTNAANGTLTEPMTGAGKFYQVVVP